MHHDQQSETHRKLGDAVPPALIKSPKVAVISKRLCQREARMEDVKEEEEEMARVRRRDKA